MTRKSRIIVLLLLMSGGAIVNVAVAWGCALLIDSYKAPKSSGGEWASDASWIGFQYDGPGVLRVISEWSYDPGVGVSADGVPRNELLPEWADPHQRPQFSGPMRSMDQHTWDGRGWPLISMYSHWQLWSDDGTVAHSKLHDGYVRGGWVHGRDKYVIPTRPIWPGLATNTIFYATIVWVLLAIPGAVKRIRRRRSGQCIHCGYDLRGQTPPPRKDSPPSAPSAGEM